MSKRLDGDTVAPVEGGTHWTRDPHKAHDDLISQLDSAHSGRINVDRTIQRLYHGRPFVVQQRDQNKPSSRYGFGAWDDLRSGGMSLVRLAIDTAAAMIVRAPGIKVLPVGQRFKVQRQCRDLGRFVQGVFHANDLAGRAYDVAIDGMTCRLGGVLWDVAGDEIVCETIDPLGLRWDAAEGKEPRSLHYIDYVPVSWAMAEYPEHAEALRKAPTEHEPTTIGVDIVSMRETPTLKRVRSWAIEIPERTYTSQRTIRNDRESTVHRPRTHTFPRVPGHRVTKLGGVLVEHDDDWDCSRHVIAVYRWAPSRKDFGGRPAGESCVPYQYELNATTATIREGQKAAIPVELVHENALPLNELKNKPLQRRVWTGNIEPKIVTGTGVGQEIYNWKTQLKLDCLEELGISSAMASSAKPAGLTAAVALREWNDYANTRLYHPAKRFEKFFEDCTRVVIMLADKAFGSKAARTRAPGTTLLEEIEFPVGIRENQYGIQVSATSGLPLTIAGRMDFAKDLADLGAIDKSTLLQMLQLPDTEAAMARANAPMDLAQTQVDKALWDCDWKAPIEYQGAEGLDMLIDIGSREYQRAYVSGVDYPAENLELLRRLIEHARLLRQGINPQAPGTPNPTAAPTQDAAPVATDAAVGAPA